MYIIAHLFICYIGVDYSLQGIELIRHQTRTYTRRKHVFGGVEEVTDSGQHLVPIGLSYVIAGLLVQFAGMTNLVSQNENLFEYFGIFWIVGAIQMVGFLMGGLMKLRRQ